MVALVVAAATVGGSWAARSPPAAAAAPTTTGSTTTTAAANASPTTAPARTPTTPPPATNPNADQLKKATADYESATADELDLLARTMAAQQQSRDLAVQVDQLNVAVGQVEIEVTAAEQTVQQADLHRQDTEVQLTQAERDLGDEQQRLRDQAVEAYIGGGSGGVPASARALLRATSMNDAGKTIVYAAAVVTDQRASVDRVVELRDRVDALHSDAQASQASAEQARDEVAAREAALVAQRADQARLAQQAEAGADRQARLLDEVAGRRSEVAQRIAVLTAVSDGISDVLRNREYGQSLPLVTNGIFLSPVPRPVINSSFGPRTDPILGTVGMHNGIDLNADMGDPIRASADGTVVIASEQGGYGNCTVIDHGSGLGTLYGHQSAFAVKVGDVVKRGQVIGFVGSTGHSTGAHLHWEVRQFGQPVNPVTYLGRG